MSTHTHTFSDWPFADSVSAASFCTTRVVHEHYPVLQVAHDYNGDWQFLDATTDDLGEPVMLCLGCVFERDPTLAEIADLPLGWGAFRAHSGAVWERWQKEPEEDDGDDGDKVQECDHDPDRHEAKALADIETYGLHIISVRAEGELPPFAYSIGIERSLGLPELIVIGLNPALAASVVNACYTQMRSGMSTTPGTRVADLLEGFDCVIGAVSPETYREYMGWALWLYQGPAFRALQIIWPTTKGVFPWDPDANAGMRDWQPLLAGDVRAASVDE